jgi:hypothetical protein
MKPRLCTLTLYNVIFNKDNLGQKIEDLNYCGKLAIFLRAQISD